MLPFCLHTVLVCDNVHPAPEPSLGLELPADGRLRVVLAQDIDRHFSFPPRPECRDSALSPARLEVPLPSLDLVVSQPMIEP